MNSSTKQIFYMILILISASCISQTTTSPTTVLNSVLNKQYIESRKSFKGKLNPQQFQEIRSLIIKELNAEIPADKSILINYSQRAPNCLSLNINNISFSGFDRSIEISKRISKKYNTIDFFVFSEDVVNKEIYEEQKDFIKDSGFFYDNVFTLHENCEAFFILKSNGDFMKYYGEDYYSKVEYFLRRN
ncbi:hypothetical protein FQU23_000115 [Flavobacterium sp. XN-5]|uniref:hypothetical protein n=1 Tax=Flavobacterium sp. XN-5 TaxID=2599390 RepID=UPI0011C8BA78|nr:hypothetical protein [Flavobacterium sp. XN-5]NGY35915.1 hypothetical protein [Flavobacterium sp. XN-5]